MTTPSGQPVPGPHGQWPAGGPNQPPNPPIPGQQPFGTPGLPGVQPGNGLLRVHIKGSVWTSSMIVPTLLVDGQQLHSQYGVNAYQVRAGRHRVDLFAQWLRQYGQAGLEVDVPPGVVVDVHYASPFNQFTTGSIGLVPQSRKGFGFLVVTIAALLALLWFVFVVLAQL
jgi:hypothetical protein